MSKFINFNWQDRMFCDFVCKAADWERLCQTKPDVHLPRKKHPTLVLSWPEFLSYCVVKDDKHAQAFMTAYDGLTVTGTVDLLEILF